MVNFAVLCCNVLLWDVMYDMMSSAVLSSRVMFCGSSAIRTCVVRYAVMSHEE